MPTDFAPGSARAATPLFSGGALLDAEKLDCYRLAVEFQALAGRLLPKRGHSSLRDQLDRASVSIVLNVAEGAGRFSPADKARFYAIARGSATECAAIVDVMLSRGLAPVPVCRQALSPCSHRSDADPVERADGSEASLADARSPHPATPGQLFCSSSWMP
jgi:four helix bundle protein